MTDPKQHLTNEHVALLQTTIHKLIEYPRLVDELTVTEVINLSTFSRRMHYSIPFPFLKRCSFTAESQLLVHPKGARVMDSRSSIGVYDKSAPHGTTMHPLWGCDKGAKPHCLPLYHRFQEFGSKYNLKQFIQCVNY